MRLVTIDIGGTHARFAIATLGADGGIALGAVVKLATRDHASFESAWAAFATSCDSPLPRAAAIAVAAPVGDASDADRVIHLVNNPWSLKPASLPGQLGVDQLTILNDFGAVGHAVARAGAEHFLHLTGPDIPLPQAGTISIVGPGTGLGVAHIWRDGGPVGKGGSYHVQSTEGGHQDFAPLDAIDDALLARLRARYPRVSAERVVSGPGIVDIHATLAALKGHPIAPADDKALWQSALSGQAPLARTAAERFCRSLGAVAGDIALLQGGTGVVIAGGLGLRLREILLAPGFATSFCAKGRFSEIMAALPVKLITHPEPGLLGAAAAFITEHGL